MLNIILRYVGDTPSYALYDPGQVGPKIFVVALARKNRVKAEATSSLRARNPAPLLELAKGSIDHVF